MDSAVFRSIYQEMQTVKDNFKLEDGSLFQLKKSIFCKIEPKGSVRVGTKLLKTNRIMWILENNQPLPPGSYTRNFNGKIICYHQCRQVATLCECGHRLMIKEYLTEECYCAKCLSKLLLPEAVAGDNCPWCKGYLVPRMGDAGMFLGCSNVTGSKASCKFMCAISKKYTVFITPEEL